MYTIQLTRGEGGRYSIPLLPKIKRDYYFSAMDFAVFRNGLLMTPGVDYSVDGLWIVPINGDWSEDDIVSALVATR